MTFSAPIRLLDMGDHIFQGWFSEGGFKSYATKGA